MKNQNQVSNANPVNQNLPCFHCGLEVDPNWSYPIEVDGQEQPTCCPGCQQAAALIYDLGLESFYQYRSESTQPVQQAQQLWDHFDAPETLKTISTPLINQNNSYEADFVIQGMSCSACSWLIEHRLKKMPGIQLALVNFSQERLHIEWDQSQLPLSRILEELARIGYPAHPYTPSSVALQQRDAYKSHLIRVTLAGVLGMQVMMLAIALYLGDYTSMQADYRFFIQLASLVLTLPVITYSAMPFYRSAIKAITSRALNMDFSVSLALLTAFIASTYNTLMQSGHVYYESACMFVFFLSLARLLQQRVEVRSSHVFESMPPTGKQQVEVLKAQGDSAVSHWRQWEDLQQGDLIRVRPGDHIYTDGKLVDDQALVSEAFLTGESQPIEKSKDDPIFAGSENYNHVIHVRVSQPKDQSRLAQIQKLTLKAQSFKPKWHNFADIAAQYFVVVLLSIVSITGAIWWIIDPTRVFEICLATLVVSCPCALSLSLPTAITAATSRAAKLGIILNHPDKFLDFGKIKAAVFDKTGTLTQEKFDIESFENLSTGYSDQQLLHLASSLEAGQSHPLASAFLKNSPLIAERVRLNTQRELEGSIAGQSYRLGGSSLPPNDTSPPNTSNHASAAYVSLDFFENQQLIGRFHLSTQLRPDASQGIRSLQRLGIPSHMFTGDQERNCTGIMNRLPLASASFNMQPEEKLAGVQALTQQLESGSKSVLMVGDGINDLPSMGVTLSVAMNTGIDITRSTADACILNNAISTLPQLVHLSRKTRKIIKQNLGWSICYNASAIPLAAMGIIPPYVAALGMSLSSLVVVINASRLNRTKSIS